MHHCLLCFFKEQTGKSTCEARRESSGRRAVVRTWKIFLWAFTGYLLSGVNFDIVSLDTFLSVSTLTPDEKLISKYLQYWPFSRQALNWRAVSAQIRNLYFSSFRLVGRQPSLPPSRMPTPSQPPRSKVGRGTCILQINGKSHHEGWITNYCSTVYNCFYHSESESMLPE